MIHLHLLSRVFNVRNAIVTVVTPWLWCRLCCICNIYIQ